MEKKIIMMMPKSLLLWSLIACLVSQSLFIPVISTSFEDQKNYYSHDPHVGSPPSGSGGSPPTSSPPSHSTPSHGTPSHGSSGGSHGPNPTPSTPSSCPTPTPSTKSPPSSGHHGGGGGYYPSPTPTTPSTPTTPTTPTTPITPSTPTTPSTPPYLPDPNSPPSTPPFLPDPNTPPFTCNYWRNHPQLIWGVLGWWGTLGNAFGVPSVPGFGTNNISLKDALSNTRTDGYGDLYREGTASLLNAMVDHKFTFNAKQVREAFVAALGSDKAAASQANLFKLANEGKH